jgi:ribulose-phosphate 3-epimerase
MTINPGFGGQEFIREGLPKIQQAAAWRRKKNFSYHISVDGGINDETACWPTLNSCAARPAPMTVWF